MKKVFNLFFINIVLFSYSFIFSKNKLDREVYIILVHGSHNIKPLFYNPFLIWNRKCDKENDTYCQSTCDSRYSQEHPRTFMLQQQGLVEIPVKESEEDIASTAELIISQLNHSWNIIHPSESEKGKKRYFVFNWNGLLSMRQRKQSGEELYVALSDMVQKRIENNETVPAIYIIGFSHGGNVALNMAEMAAKEEKKFFTIEHLVLLATPAIPYLTSKHASSYFFKNVSSVISPGDWIQGSDLSVPGMSFTSKQRIKNVTRDIYEFSVELGLMNPLNTKQRKYYGHSQMGYVCWEDEREILVPAIVFLPFIIEYMPFFKSKKLIYIKIINNKDDITCISINQKTICSGENLYGRYLDQIKRFGVKSGFLHE